MDRRRVLAGIAAGVTVGTAGCGDESGDESADRPFPDAEWRDGDGLALAPLAESHAETLVDAGGVTLYSTATTEHDGDDEPSPWLPSQTYESRYDLENGRQYLRQEIPGETEVSELYVADGMALFRQQMGDDVQYDRQPVERADGAVASAMREEVVTGIRVEREAGSDGEAFEEGLSQWNPTTDGGAEIRGEQTARFTSETFDGDRSIPATIETASATVHVYESGVVPQISQSWEGEHDGQQATTTIDIDYQDVGATLTEPEWVDEARE